MKHIKNKLHMSGSSLKALWSWSGSQRVWLLVMCLGNMILSALVLWVAVITRGIIDSAVSTDRNGLVIYGILLVSVMLFQIIIGWILGRVQMRIRARLTRNLRRRIFSSLMDKQYLYVGAYHSGELVNRMFSDVNVVTDGIVTIVPVLFSMATQFIGAAIIIASIDIRFVLVLVLVSLAALGLSLIFRKRSKLLHKNSQEAEGRVHALLQELLENMRLIKASGSERRMEVKAENYQEEHYRAQIKKSDFAAFTNLAMSLAFTGSWLYAMVWGCVGIFTSAFSYGTFTATMQLVGHVQSPFANMSSLAAKIYSTLSSTERLTELDAIPEEKKTETGDVEKVYESMDMISAVNLNFAYKKELPILCDVNFELKKGDFAALTGLSGGGKSTLFHLLLGIYTPVSGDIVLKDIFGNSHSVDGGSRKLFAYVPQGNILFSGSLRDNVSLFRDKITDEEIKHALDIACIGDFVAALPDGLDTVIGENAMGLSEGQAQRIAIARAIASGAPILLLDEATSALDEDTEADVLRGIASLKDKSCLIVTHRRAALDICNLKLHLEDGRLLVNRND